MPELPEVQTVTDDLNKKIKGDIIVDFESSWPKTIKGKSLVDFKKEIIGRKVLGARRIGKNLFIDLSGGKTLYIHLKMTGHLLIKSQVLNPKSKNLNYFDDRVNQYIRHKFFLKTDAKLRNSDESTNKKLKSVEKFVDSNSFVGSHRYDKVIDFSDMRKFAKIVLGDKKEIAELPEIRSLGLDAMSAEFTLAKFNDILDRKEKSPIGIILMDQSLIAGIGNIYRSEILFEAGVAVERKAKDLLPEERKKIFQETKKVLKKAIKMRGTSDSDYRDTSGAPGRFQTVLKVYGKTGKDCPKCGKIIKRKTVGQRSVFYCSTCQK